MVDLMHDVEAVNLAASAHRRPLRSGGKAIGTLFRGWKARDAAIAALLDHQARIACAFEEIAHIRRDCWDGLADFGHSI